MQAVQPGVCERGLLRTPQGRAGPQGSVTGRSDWSSVRSFDRGSTQCGGSGSARSGSISQRLWIIPFSEIMLAKYRILTENFNKN
jgi:hypothetical protein